MPAQPPSGGAVGPIAGTSVSPRTASLPAVPLDAVLSVSPRLLTAEDLAARWQVDKAHVYRLAREGLLPCVRLGRYRRFSLDAVAAFEANGGTADA